MRGVGDRDAGINVASAINNLGMAVLNSESKSFVKEGINDFGQVVGQYVTLEGRSHAFWEGGAMWLEPVRSDSGAVQDLGTLGGITSEATAINSSSQITGTSTIGSSGNTHAFLFNSLQGMQDLGTLGGSDAIGYALNVHSQVVGMSKTADGSEHAFVMRSNKLVDLNTLVPSGLGFVLKRAYGINDLGQIIATGSDGHSYLLTTNSGHW
jgi:probable HAF family extracellular repeat protein